MKNKLTDLNNHLFEQLERLNDEELSGEKLQQEIERAKAITSVATQIISTADTNLKVASLMIDYGYKDNVNMPKLLGVEQWINTQRNKESFL